MMLQILGASVGVSHADLYMSAAHTSVSYLPPCLASAGTENLSKDVAWYIASLLK